MSFNLKSIMISQLWQSEKHRLADRLHQRVLRGRDAAACREFFGNGLPEIFEILVRKYARRRLEEAIHLLNPNRFDLPACADRKNETFYEALISGTKLTSDELAKLCRSAVNLQYDILVRPRAALCHLLFASFNECRRDDVIVIAEGFGEERPFVKKLLATLRTLPSPRILRDMFETLTRAAEQDVLKETPISSLLTDFKLLMDFESQATGKICIAISSPVLLGMLVERELGALADNLSQESEKASWTLAEIESALQRYWLVSAPPGDSSGAIHENEPDEPMKLAFVEGTYTSAVKPN
jgi:hypothetical protein